MKAEDYITIWCDETYKGGKELGDWTTAEVMKFANDFLEHRKLMKQLYPKIVRHYEGFIILAQNEKDFKSKVQSIKRGDTKGFYTVERALLDIKDIQVNAVPSNTPLNHSLDIADVSRSLFIELAVRANLIFPVTEQELDWFDEGTDFKKCGDFMPRLFNEVYRIHNNG